MLHILFNMDYVLVLRVYVIIMMQVFKRNISKDQSLERIENVTIMSMRKR